MFRINDQILIDRPIEDVFAFVADLENAPLWQTGVVQSRRLTDGPTRLGTRFDEDVNVMGRHFKATCEIIEFDPPRVMAFTATSTGPVQYEGRFTFEPADGGTEVRVAGRAWLKGFWRLIEPMFAGETRRELKGELVNIKAALEKERQPA